MCFNKPRFIFCSRSCGNLGVSFVFNENSIKAKLVKPTNKFSLFFIVLINYSMSAYKKITQCTKGDILFYSILTFIYII